MTGWLTPLLPRQLRLVFASVAIGQALVAAPASYRWAPSGLDGSGMQNCITLQPGNADVMVSAGDVSGFNVTEDGGRHWLTRNLGAMPPDSPPQVATVAFDPEVPSLVYGGSGKRGRPGSGGFLVSEDAGKTWRLASAVPTFSGNGPDYPRPTGELIAVRAGAGKKIIYAGTYLGGLQRSTDGGASWVVAGLRGKDLRCVLLDAQRPDRVYVAEKNGHLWRCDAAETCVDDSSWSRLEAAPSTCEELLQIDKTLYAVGTDRGSGGGLWKSTDPDHERWTKLAPEQVDAKPTWTAIAGYRDGNHDVLFIGATHAVPQPGSAKYRGILRSQDGGVNWQPLTLEANVRNETGGAGGPPWWMGAQGGAPGFLLGGRACDIASLKLDPQHHNHLVMGGRGGVWVTDNADAPAGTVAWFPMVRGLMVCVDESVIVDPRRPGVVYAANEDRVLFWSTDYGRTWRRHAPEHGGTTSFALAVDPENSQVYSSLVETRQMHGDVISSADPTNFAHPWESEGLSDAAGNHAVQGVTVGRDADGNTVLLAAVYKSGLWRKHLGRWTKVSDEPQPGGWTHVDFVWNHHSPYVFVFEGGSGLWRSSDYGATWTHLLPEHGGRGAGYAAGNPDRDGDLFIAGENAVLHVTAATTASPVVTALAGPDAPRALAYRHGKLYACDHVTAAHPARLFRWDDVERERQGEIISDTEFYPGQCGWPTGIAIDDDETIYVSNVGNSVMVGRPSARP